MRKCLILLLVFFLVSISRDYAESFLSNSLDILRITIQSFLKKEFSNLLLITDLSKKRMVDKLISEYQYGFLKPLVDKEVSNVKCFEILDTYFEHDFAVVVTDCEIQSRVVSKSVERENIVSRRGLYLPRRFNNNGQWKIISKNVEI